MGYARSEVGMCAACGYDNELYPIDEDTEPEYCEDCLAYLQARTEALYDAKFSEQ